MKSIAIIVDTKGNSQVQTQGFAGSSCLQASRFIEQALGQAVAERKTPEFFVSAKQKTEAAQTRF